MRNENKTELMEIIEDSKFLNLVKAYMHLKRCYKI